MEMTLITAAVMMAGASAVARQSARRLALQLHFGWRYFVACVAAMAAVGVCASRSESILWLPGIVMGAISAYTDVEFGLIFDRVLVLGGALTGLIALDIGGIPSVVMAASAAAAIPWIVHVSTRGAALGLGDVKLAALLGSAVGSNAVPLMLTVACIAGGAVGIALLISGHRRQDTMPFGPCLTFGACIAVLQCSA